MAFSNSRRSSLQIFGEGMQIILSVRVARVRRELLPPQTLSIVFLLPAQIGTSDKVVCRVLFPCSATWWYQAQAVS
jgi:hypothetical protein